jgi:hypothetical protein
MRTLILTLLVLIAAPSVASAKLHLFKQPGDLPKPIHLKHGADPQNPKQKHKLFHKHHDGHGCDECGDHGHHRGHGLFHRHR